MFIAPGTLLNRWTGFNVRNESRREALSRLAARDCIASVLQLRHPSVQRFAESVRTTDQLKLQDLPGVSHESARWWWDAAPQPPARPPRLGSVAASIIATEIWQQATAAELDPFDLLTFSATPNEHGILGRLRFQVIDADPAAFRPWIDFILVPVEQAYYRLLGTNPPELFTATVAVAAGRLTENGIHLPAHKGTEAVKDAISRHIASFKELISLATPTYLIDSLLPDQRFNASPHFAWRLPLALAATGRSEEGLQILTRLDAETPGLPHSRARHELHWLRRRLIA